MKTPIKNERGKLTPIIKSRIPPGLQMIFLASNRGEMVHMPPPPSISSICRNWQEVSRRPATKRSACFDIPYDEIESSIDSVDSADDEFTLTLQSDHSSSSVDSCDLELLQELEEFCKASRLEKKFMRYSRSIPIVSRWDSTRSSLPKQTTRATSRWDSSMNDYPPHKIISSRGLSPTTSHAHFTGPLLLRFKVENPF